MIKQFFIIFLIAFIPDALYGNTLPFVKIYKATGSSFILSTYKIQLLSKELENEKSILTESLQEIGVKEAADGVVIHLLLSDIALPVKQQKYREQIYQQGYRLQISSDNIKIESPSPTGIYYGIRTFP